MGGNAMTETLASEASIPCGRVAKFQDKSRSLERHEYRFENGYGAHVIRCEYSMGGLVGLWELAVILCDPQNKDVWQITYETPITDDVVGHLTETDVNSLLQDIKALPPREGFGSSEDESHETQHKIPPITAEDIEALRRSYS